MDNELIEELANMTFAGLALFYRDTDLEPEIRASYVPGEIILSTIFLDVTPMAGRPAGNTRFLIASSRAAPLYKINPEMEKWRLHTINANSFFKILDVYEKDGFTQILLMHIPRAGLELFQSAKINLEDQVVDAGRAGLDKNLAVETPPELLEPELLKRCEIPPGLDDENRFFPLHEVPALPEAIMPLYSAIARLADADPEVW